jgi:hypothetical protein
MKIENHKRVKKKERDKKQTENRHTLACSHTELWEQVKLIENTYW